MFSRLRNAMASGGVPAHGSERRRLAKGGSGSDVYVRARWFGSQGGGAPCPRNVLRRADTEDVQAVEGYQMPSQAITSLLDTPVPPSYAFSPDRTKILRIERPPPHPPLREFMRPELKLAGMRLDAAQCSRARLGHSVSIAMIDYAQAPALFDSDASEGNSAAVSTGAPLICELPAVPLRGVPEGMLLNYVRWSPRGARVAFTLRSAGGADDPPRGPLALYTAPVHDFAAAPVPGADRLNTIFEDFVFLDDDTLIASVIPKDHGSGPQEPEVPVGPKVSDNTEGRTSKARTYPDLLTSNHDADMFEHLVTAALVRVDLESGASTPIGEPRMYTQVEVSPDGQRMLVAWIERPFSFELPVGRFPRVWQVWDRDGNVVHEVCRLPLLTSLPIEFDATREGPRAISWRSDKAATLKWVEAQDKGDPKNNPDVSPRDVVFTLDLTQPAQGQQPLKLCGTDFRYGGIAWCDDELALLYESRWEDRRSRVWTFQPGSPSAEPAILFDRNYEDIYTDPGSPIAVRHPQYPTSVLARIDGGDQLLMQGEGASAEGNRPFLDVLDLATKESRRIWQSAAPYYECPAGVILNEPNLPIASSASNGSSGASVAVSLDDLQVLFSKETPKDPPQFYIKRFTDGGSSHAEVQLTNEPHPYPELRDMQRDILQYSRSDGVGLNAELFTPPGYEADRDGPLPCILWAYPREFKSKDAAGQLDASPYEFSNLSASSPLVWLARGYAVLSGPSMPIVAEGDEQPNDSYVSQLVASVEAAIDEVSKRGVVDKQRVAVGGHSYGAFMTANLLAHAGHLFACGVAQSGAYNRTLTPFGFQAEQRTFWDAPEVYAAMAPFNNADKIEKPILLVHGEADNNTGTFPLQSERMYAALQGHGCKARLVVLPHESHGYRAYESVMHVLAEKEKWFDAYCKDAVSSGEPAPAAGAASNGAAADASAEPAAAAAAT